MSWSEFVLWQVLVWELADGQIRRELTGHLGEVPYGYSLFFCATYTYRNVYRYCGCTLYTVNSVHCTVYLLSLNKLSHEVPVLWRTLVKKTKMTLPIVVDPKLFFYPAPDPTWVVHSLGSSSGSDSKNALFQNANDLKGRCMAFKWYRSVLWICQLFCSDPDPIFRRVLDPDKKNSCCSGSGSY
jgi:hypothetical protein